jgi:uncharacterized protein (UPF0332 family)
MTIEDLLRERRIHKHQTDIAVIRALVERAGEDLASAAHMLEQDADWALSIAYNAVLRSARALVFARGFRPASHEAHKTTFAFLREIAPEDQQQLISYFDRIRVKRHRIVYDVEARTSRTEAETLIEQARRFLEWTRRELDVS